MRKIIAFASLLLVTAAPAFAASVVDAVNGGYVLHATAPASSVIGKLSKGVVIGVQYSGTGYAINTYHLQGTKFFGTAFDSTALYFKDVGTAATLTVPSSSVGADAFATGWTKM